MQYNWLALAALMALGACDAVGPDYLAPRMALQDSYVLESDGALQEAAQERWWEGFNDSMLNHLIRQGMPRNLDLKAARERIRTAQAELRQTGDATLASGDLTTQATRAENDGVTDSAGFTLGLNYVLDLFGGARRGREQALASLQAAQLDEGTVRLAYLGELVDAYVNARFFQQSATVNRATIRSRRQTLDLVQRLREEGSATVLEVQQARAQLSAAEAQLPAALAGYESNVYRLAFLIAAPGGPVKHDLDRGGSQPKPKSVGDAGVPADLLRNRPDIRAAERRLAAATAAVGVAEADLYPSVSISGSITDTSASSTSWSFGPRITFPVLGRGVLQAVRDERVSEARSAEIEWRRAIFDAVRDVETQISQTKRQRTQLNALEKAARASSRVLSLSRESYQSGGILFTEVLDAERDNFINQLAAVTARRDLALAWARLQIGVGKGSVAGTGPAEQVASAE